MLKIIKICCRKLKTMLKNRNPISPIGLISPIGRMGLVGSKGWLYYKNQRLSLPMVSGIHPLLKYGAILATISGYLIVTGRFCCRTDFQ